MNPPYFSIKLQGKKMKPQRVSVFVLISFIIWDSYFSGMHASQHQIFMFIKIYISCIIRDGWLFYAWNWWVIDSLCLGTDKYTVVYLLYRTSGISFLKWTLFLSIKYTLLVRDNPVIFQHYYINWFCCSRKDRTVSVRPPSCVLSQTVSWWFRAWWMNVLFLERCFIRGIEIDSPTHTGTDEYHSYLNGNWNESLFA